MLKHELRKHYTIKRKQLELDGLLEKNVKISNRLLELPIWKFSFFHTFLSITAKKEVDTEPILTLLQGKDKNIVLPKMIGSDGLENFLLTDDLVLLKNKWGIPEPKDGILVPEEKLDVVFVPLLAYDQKGNRVGYGKGFYDRFLQKCREDVIKVGLSYFGPETIIEDVEDTDIPLSYCVTPEKIYAF